MSIRVKALLVALGVLAAAVTLAACGGGGSTITTGEYTVKPPEIEDWPLFGRDTDNTRFATQDEINTGNVDDLGEAWSTDLGPDQFLMESYPLVIGETIYVTTSTDEVIALDGKTGKTKWTYTPEVDFSQSTGVGGYGVSVNRGVAAADGKLFVLTFDNKLQAISQKTGEKLWSSQVGRPDDRRLRVDGAERLRRQGLRRRVRLRGRGARQARGLRPEDRQENLDLLHGAQGGDRLGAERRRWRHDLHAADDRHQDRDRLRGHRQPGAGDHRRQTAGEEPLHRLDHRPRRQHRRTALVPPGAGARPLGLRRREPGRPLQRRNRRPAPARRRRGGQERAALPARREDRQEPLPLGAVREARPHAAGQGRRARVPRRRRRLAVLAARLQPGNAGGLRLRDQHLHDPQSHLRGPQRRESLRRRPRRARRTPKRPAPSPPSRRSPAR